MIYRLSFLLLLSILFLGCGHAGPASPLRLQPGLDAAQGPYSREGGDMVFESGPVRVSVRPLTECCAGVESEFLADLFARGYTILLMKIENRSDAAVMYNPSHTSLLAGPMDFKKPLNYTDLYFVARQGDGAGLPEKRLSSLRGKFYDLNTRLAPGASASKLLIFSPLQKGGRGFKAHLMIKELYTGTDTISLDFPFHVRKGEE